MHHKASRGASECRVEKFKRQNWRLTWERIANTRKQHNDYRMAKNIQWLQRESAIKGTQIHLKILSEYTNCFCRHNDGSREEMYAASRVCRWKLDRPVSRTRNQSGWYASAHFLLSHKCLAMADCCFSGFRTAVLPLRRGFLIDDGICCDTRSQSRCSVLPTYLWSQRHLYS